MPPARRGQVPHVAAGGDDTGRIEAGLQEKLLKLAPGRWCHAAVPFEVGDRGEPARPPAGIFETQPPQLDGGLGIDRQGPVRAQAAVLGLEGGIAEPVTAGVAIVGRPAGGGRERPDLVRIAVPEIEETAGAVFGKILLPAHEHRQLGVVDPGEAAAGLRNGEADARVGNDIDPGPRRPGIGDHVLGAVVRKVTVPAHGAPPPADPSPPWPPSPIAPPPTGRGGKKTDKEGTGCVESLSPLSRGKGGRWERGRG